MRPSSFVATILDGHKGAAVELPFDPADRWGIPPGPLWKGRRGHHVRATINGAAFESAIVPRSRTFFLLLDETALAASGAAVGDQVRVRVEPLAATAPEPRKHLAKPPKRRSD